MSECFMTYSGLELWQMKEIEKILVNKGAQNLYQYHISKNLYGMNIHGETFFSLFFFYPKVLDIAYFQIQEYKTQMENYDLL
jgi:serine acetyltransferase